MKRLQSLFVSFLALFNIADAQYYFYNNKYYGGNVLVEAGVAAGLMNSLTDLGGRKGVGKAFIKDLNWKVTRPGLSSYLLAMYKERVALRLESALGSVTSYDGLLKKPDPNLAERYGRNLSLRSRIIELQLSAEIHPLFFVSYDENKAPFWSPYLVAGIGYFFFNPQACLDGRWHSLHPLRLEGQGIIPGQQPYKLGQVNIPLGAGIRYEAGACLLLRLEIMYRILFTDYLDDVSTTYIDPSVFLLYLQPAQAAIAQRLYSRMQELQPAYRVYSGMPRGDPDDNDAFFTIQLKLGWVINRGKR